MIEAFFMVEKRDIVVRSNLNTSEYSAFKQRAEQVGLSESAYIRVLALQDIDRAMRDRLCQEAGLLDSTELRR